ncbi:MmcQ/YjbR family DNA-binding protein [Capnocytophaga sp. ARDL2]|uniref:MmcQ/YjbR family DNA-binding protein n=1 Tax=Capnocytophaga sp. ARDL2 TaxID=3238809 RepID=UPI0035578564
MNIEQLRDFCLSFPEAGEKMPFDDDILVFTVCDKIFCLVSTKNYEFMNLKCNPEKAIELRERYSEVSPGYHMNKKHWNSVRVEGNLSEEMLKEWISDSYWLVVNTLPKKRKELLKSNG